MKLKNIIMNRADLHIHSYASDGTMSATDIIETASEIGLEFVSITDHDGIGAYTNDSVDLPEISSKAGIELISGIEFDSDFNGIELHILGYGIDVANERLNSYLEKNHRMRNERIIRLIDHVNSCFGEGTIYENDVFLPVSDTLMKPHLIRLLLKKGLFKNYSEAKRWMSENTDADVVLIKPSPDQIISLIHHSGGEAVLAHPGYYIVDLGDEIYDLIKKMADEGMAGLEVYYNYSYMSPDLFKKDDMDRMISDFKGLAERLNLVSTFGSDSHSVRELEERNGIERL